MDDVIAVGYDSHMHAGGDIVQDVHGCGAGINIYDIIFLDVFGCLFANQLFGSALCLVPFRECGEGRKLGTGPSRLHKPS